MLFLGEVGMEFLSRSSFGWGRTSARAADPKSGLVIHYDGPGSRLTEKSHEKCIEYWRSVRRYHVSSNGWSDIGYSFGVCPHSNGRGEGYTFEGRGLYREQAAQPGGNTTFYSVSLMLGDGEKPTDIQVQTVRELREWLIKKTGMRNVVKGHRDFISTKCPGDILYDMVKKGVFNKPLEVDDLPSVKEVWQWDGIPAPKNASTYDKNPTWMPASHLTDINERVRELQKAVRELSAKVDKIAGESANMGE